MNKWTRRTVGELLSRSADTVLPLPDASYQEITVRLWGRGVVPRGTISGSAVSGRRYRASAGQFIASRIDARNGALGIVPQSLDGALVTNDFPLFAVNENLIDGHFLSYLSRTEQFVSLCKKGSEGTTNRVRLKESRFLALPISLPPLEEQRRIAGELADIESAVLAVLERRTAQAGYMHSLLESAFEEIASKADTKAMGEVAPIVRRPVEIDPNRTYAEIGIRSFGKGIFHKPPISGIELGDKRIFSIEPGDLVFSNVFAWEGAIAVAEEGDKGRVGSHRFITCIPKTGVGNARYLAFYFQTERGLDQIREASPGGAGRNRTLGVAALERISVPVANYQQQLWFADLLAQADKAGAWHGNLEADAQKLLPAALSERLHGCFSALS